jgi:DNA-binding transcriptional ArsR family regulator
VLDLAVIEDPAAAEVSLDPVRVRLLAELAEPGTATMLATSLGLPRQNVNYHLKALERHGLVELMDERRKGNVTERLLRATALSYVISPVALERGPARPLPIAGPAVGSVADRARRPSGPRGGATARRRHEGPQAARDVRHGRRGAVRLGGDRAAFAEELATAVTGLIGRYHDESAHGGREHRVIVAVHPGLKPRNETDGKES